MSIQCSACSTPIGPFTVTCEACEKLRVPFTLRMKAIVDLEWSIRSYHCMLDLGIVTVGELCQWSAADLLACPNFGRKSLNEVKEELHRWGLHLRPDNVHDHYRDVAATRGAQRGEG